MQLKWSSSAYHLNHQSICISAFVFISYNTQPYLKQITAHERKALPYNAVLHMRILYLLLHRTPPHPHTHTRRESGQASLELYANTHHQSAKCVRDCRDSKTEWTLNRSNIHLHLCRLVRWAKAHASKEHEQIELENQSQMFRNNVNEWGWYW